MPTTTASVAAGPGVGARVLIARAGFPDLVIEERVLGAIGADIIDGRTADDLTLTDLCREVDAVITDYFELRRPVIERMSRCLVICQYGVGLDAIDVAAATEQGIIVTHTPGFCTNEVADHALALLLSLWRRLWPLQASVRAGNWDYLRAGPIRRISGSVLGLVGYGRIARALAARARATGFTVIASDPLLTPALAVADGVEVRDLDAVLDRADAISLHVPLTPDTHHLIGARELARLQPHAILINTARGGLIDQRALVDALEQGRLGGVGLDVLETEPPTAAERLLQHPNAIITPHAAFYSRESVQAVQTLAAEAVAAVLTGQLPAALANPDVVTRRRAPVSR